MPQSCPLPSTSTQDRLRTDFSFFLYRNRGLLLKISTKHRAMGILDEDDIYQEAFIAWQLAKETFDPTRNITFLRFVISKVEVILHEKYRILRRGGLNYDDNNTGEDDFFIDAAIIEQTETTEVQLSLSPEELMTDEEPEPAMVDLLNGISIHTFSHTPLYQNDQYRRAFQTAIAGNGYAPSDGAFSKDLSEEFGVTRRRCTQIIQELLHHLYHPSLKRDRQMLQKNHSAVVELLYEDLENLQVFDPEDRDRSSAIERSAVSLQSFFSPIIVDQYYRVLDGAQRVYAARRMRYHKVPIIIHVLQGSLNIPDDSKFLEARSHYTGARSRFTRSRKRTSPSSTVTSKVAIMDHLTA